MDSPDDNQKLVNDMVRQLENKGYACLVIAVSSTKHFQGGSKLGVTYLEKQSQIVVEFAAFVQDYLQRPVYAETNKKCNSFPKKGDRCDRSMDTTFLKREDFTFNSGDKCQATPRNIPHAADMENSSVNEERHFKILRSVTIEPCENDIFSVCSDVESNKEYVPHPLSQDNLKPFDEDKIDDIVEELPSEIENLQCDKCGKSFRFKSVLESHKKRLISCVDEDVLMLGMKCNETLMYKDKEENTISITVTEAMKILKTECIICSFKTNKLTNLRRHFIIAHCKERPFNCNYCSKTFKLQSLLNRHLSKTHVTKKILEFSCELCKQTFLTEKQLRHHKVFKCEMRNKPGKCNVCGYESTSNAIMSLHKRLHTGEKPYSCPLCELTFVTERSLDKHLDIHLGNNSYKCNQCELKFTSKAEFNSHKKIHKKKTSGFKCKLCEKTLSHKSALNYHMMIHSGTKPFMCDTCGQAFRKKERLKAHMDQHLGITPYQCQVCKKGFSSVDGLRVHKLIHTERCHTCEQCGKSFYRRGKLTQHYKTHQKA